MKGKHMLIVATMAGLLGLSSAANADHKHHGHGWKSHPGRHLGHYKRHHRHHYRAHRHYRDHHRHYAYPRHRHIYRDRPYRDHRGYGVDFWVDGLRVSWYEYDAPHRH